MPALALPRLTVDRAALLRGGVAGGAWGVAVATALLGLSFYQCGTICLGQFLETSVLSVAAGIVAIGPIAALRRKTNVGLRHGGV